MIKIGLHISQLGKILLFLIIIIPLLILVPFVFKGAERAGDISLCRNWVSIQGFVKDPLLGTKLLNLKNSCVTFQDEAKGNKYEVYETIANGMHDTWKMYGEGIVDFFSDKKFLTGALDSNVYCLIGDEISFEKKIIINIDEFEEYINHNYPPNKEETYAEFFMKREKAIMDFGDGDITIEPSEKLYAIFAIEKKSREGWELFETAKTGLIEAVGIFIVTPAILTKGKSLPVRLGKITIPKGMGFEAPLKSVTKLKPTIPKGGWVTVGIVAAYTIGYTLSDQSIVYPSIILIKGENIVYEGCELGIHYNPKTITSKSNQK